MIKMFRDTMRKGYNSVAKLNAHEMKPAAFDMNLADLGKMHNLRMWYTQNSPNQAKKYQYLRETEMLHDEITYMALLNAKKRFLVVVLGILGYYFIWLEPQSDKYDFSQDYDLKNITKSFASLEDGGFEVIV